MHRSPTSKKQPPVKNVLSKVKAKLNKQVHKTASFMKPFIPHYQKKKQAQQAHVISQRSVSTSTSIQSSPKVSNSRVSTSTTTLKESTPSSQNVVTKQEVKHEVKHEHEVIPTTAAIGVTSADERKDSPNVSFSSSSAPASRASSSESLRGKIGIEAIENPKDSTPDVVKTKAIVPVETPPIIASPTSEPFIPKESALYELYDMFVTCPLPYLLVLSLVILNSMLVSWRASNSLLDTLLSFTVGVLFWGVMEWLLDTVNVRYRMAPSLFILLAHVLYSACYFVFRMEAIVTLPSFLGGIAACYILYNGLPSEDTDNPPHIVLKQIDTSY